VHVKSVNLKHRSGNSLAMFVVTATVTVFMRHLLHAD